jgi:aminopeptidase N
MKSALPLLLVLLGLLSCKTPGDKKPSGSPAKTAPAASSDLSWTEAQDRKARLSEVQYQLAVELNDGENDKTFRGQSVIRFQLREANRPLRLEFFEGKIFSLKVNGQTIGPEAKSPYWISLPAAQLKEGANTVEITYEQDYSRQGQGLHRFVDPQTKEVFLYTQFETFDNNRFMPSFDQPDLRATLELTVDAPAAWEVASTTTPRTEASGKGRTRWSFPATDPISTYLFSLIAGPFKIYRDQFENIPLRLFVRPSMAKYVRTKEWFTITKQGLKFYNSYFGLRYPFKKYDQLIVPEFNAGAMENVAAVTFSENYLFRSEPTRDQSRNLAGTILHEMAHMWFGDIVTMKWWNDLWLNESFATFMAATALHEATEFKEAWQDFFIDEKNWAYWEDSLVTTHPIEAPVNSVKDAFANFDGITYGKGAAVLKQLRAYITPAAFQRGIQTYIKTHAFKNAELKDFIAALQAQTDRDLNLWSTRWLRQAGTDKIAAKWTCENGSLAKVDLITTPAKGAQFRPQTVTVAIFQDKKGQLSAAQTIRVDLTKPVETLTGPWPCPAFVYPNFQDDGYIAVSLDPASLTFARAHLSGIDDKLLRSMVWDDVWEMVRNTELPLKDYIGVVKTNFPAEQDALLIKMIVSTISGRENTSVLNYWPQDERAKPERDAFVAQMENEYLRRFKNAKPGSDSQRLWFDDYVSIAATPKALEVLAQWSGKNQVAKGMPLDLDRGWNVAKKLSRYQHPKASEVLTSLKIKDTSDRGRRQALSGEAIQPNLKVKEKWIGIFKEPKPAISYAELRSVARVLFPIEQRDLAKRFEEDFYDYLNKNGNSENEIFVETVAQAMAPLSCAQEESTRLREFLKTPGRFTPSVSKTLRVSLDEDERCQRIRAMSSL